jgi:PAS domain S-box-containing protein
MDRDEGRPPNDNYHKALPLDELAESRLAAIIASADDGIISKTLQGIITSWNAGAERIFGYTEDEIVGRSILTLIPPDLQSEEDVILGKIAAGERVEHYETVRLAKDGRPVNVSLTISPLKGPDGTIVGASKIVRDVTQRRRTEADLKEQTEVVETINRIGRVLSAELDQEKLVQAVTDAATDLTGAEFGAFFYNVIDADGGSYMLYTLSGVPREAFSNFPMPRATDMFGPTFRGEGTIRIGNVRDDPRYGNNPPYNGMPEGHLPVTSYLAVSVMSRSAEVIGGLFFGHSREGVFTERHERLIEGLAAQTAIAIDNARLFEKAQKMIEERENLLVREKQAREQAEIASRSKDEFLSLLSHELRTPLNAIMGWTRMLTSTQLEPSAIATALETIDRNAQLQSRLIDDMLDVSRIMSGKLRLDAQPVDLTSAINSAVDTLRPAADAKEIRIYVVLDFGSGTVLGDPTRLQQVVWNLLSNAIKFTPKGGSVRVSLERVNSHYEVNVSDTGPGIDPAFLPHVFERFRQADSSTTKNFGGLGLGLAIVRQLVELHGGTVEAGNLKDGTGAIFTIKLPVMVTRTATAPPEPEPVNRVLAGDSPFDCPPELDGVKVLAVDDDEDSRTLLSVILSKCGANVITCGSADEAIRALRSFRPDIVISDIGMPGEDGYALIRRIRSEHGGKKIPAVALTAFARVEDRMKALSAGFNMHVPKPVEPAELITVVASLISHN